MALVGLEVVVDGVQGDGVADLGRAARRVVDVVVGEGDLVAVAEEEHRPVVLVVARGAPAGLAVQLRVGDAHASCGFIAGDEHLAADERDLDMVQPDEVAAGHLEGVSAPDVLRVEFRDVDVLEDDVLCPTDETETLASDHTLVADTDDRLVGLDVNGIGGRNVIGDRHRWIAGATPVGAVKSVLATALLELLVGIVRDGYHPVDTYSTSVAVRTATILSLGALGAGEVILLVQKNDTGLIIREPGSKLIDIGRYGRRSIATAGHTRSKTDRRSYDIALGCDQRSQVGGCDKRAKHFLGKKAKRKRTNDATSTKNE